MQQRHDFFEVLLHVGFSSVNYQLEVKDFDYKMVIMAFTIRVAQISETIVYSLNWSNLTSNDL